MGYLRTCHLVLLAVVFASICHAQHYTPEVCLHDAAQRMFPVEAARVMAWMENQKSDRIGEITWQVAGEINGRSEWKIGWKSRQGGEIASATVTYDVTKLNSGPGYFRDVWSQLMDGLHFEAGKGAGTASELEAAFWRGSAREGGTRTNAVANAQVWLNQGSPRSKAQDAAELAGLLAQGATPILGGSCTLDYLMLSRAASWLCHAEALSGVALTREWCVIAHLGGREIPASLAWKEAKDAAKLEAPSWRWWDMILTNYPAKAKDVCLFATTPGLTESGLPFVLSYLRYETGASRALENILAELYGQKLLSQPDYTPLLSEWFVMGRLRTRCFQLARKNQRDWLELLTLQKQPGADELSSIAADAADSALAAMDDDEGKDVPIPGLAATGKVVQLGAKAHNGPLSPQAAVSSAELLVHGWESSLQVWRQIYEYFDYRLGIPETAAAVGRGVRASAPSLGAMMVSRTQKPQDPSFPLTWLEYLEEPNLNGLVIRQKGRGTPKAGDPGLAIQFLRNCMKRGPAAYDQWNTLFPSNTGEVSSTRLAEMLLKQSSENSMSYACKFYHIRLPEHVRARFLEQGVTLFEKTRKACPNALKLLREVLAGELNKSPVPALEAAQKLESHYWLAPGSDHIALIMEKYVEANAPQAAARFYSQALEVDGGSIGFSNTEAPMRWALAWLEGNKDDMAAADKDASSYSSIDLEKHCLQALCAGDYNMLTKTGEACLKRYGPAPNATSWLLSMPPYLDALKDKDNPRHLEAQSQFLRGGEYPHIQFIILMNLEIPKEECIKMLEWDGRKDYQQLLINYWKGYPIPFQKMRETMPPYRRNQMPPMFRLILAHLSAQLFKVPKASAPDLKPALETRIDVLVRKAMAKTGVGAGDLR